MDQEQNNHLKAYGIAFFGLTKNMKIEWLLNYRGGSFLFDADQIIASECRLRGVSFEFLSGTDLLKVYSKIDQENMDIVLLEKKPNIAIYTPPNKQPWDDAVTLALTYAEVDYETLWDEAVTLGELEKYDWLHLHHEDFTGNMVSFIGVIIRRNGTRIKKFNLKTPRESWDINLFMNRKKESQEL